MSVALGSSADPSGLQVAGDRAVDLERSKSKKVLVLYTGGTIGMKKNAKGALEPCKGYLTNEMRSMSELKERSLVAAFDIIEYDPLFDSSDMTPADYMKMANDIVAAYDRYDGFLVAHGTDTMHYTSAALSFLLYNLCKPVIVTGAMVPLAQPVNDARRNLILGMMLASNSTISEVCLFFNDSVFRGNRCDKVLHTFGAFQSLAYPALGIIHGKRFILRQSLMLRQPTGRIRIMSDMQGGVFVFSVRPDCDLEALLAVMCPMISDDEHAKVTKTRGVVLVVHGIGGVHGRLASILKRIEQVALQEDVVICVTTPDIQRVLGSQSITRLRQIAPSFVYLSDMCQSTAEVKLMYLFGKGLSSDDVRKEMVLNIRGEVSPVAEANL